jgi:hypothetical protein
MKKNYSLAMLLMVGISSVWAQGTVVTSPPLTANNGQSGVTFEVESSVPIIITEIANTFNSGAVPASLWMRVGGVQHNPGAAPNITAANGWTQVITSVTATGNNTTPVPFPGGPYSINIAANTPVGFFVEAGTRYQSHTGPPDVFTDGTLTIRTGTNFGYGGPAPSPTFHPRQFLGSITYTLAGPCTAPPVAGAVAARDTTVCAGGNTRLTVSGGSAGMGQTYQWQSSPDNITWTNMLNDTLPGVDIAPMTNTYYRCIVTCSGQSTNTSSLLINAVGTPTPGGTYTINSNAPTGGTNYNSFGDFFNIVSCGGITGPVVLNVVPGSGPYNEQVMIGQIGGTSAINSIAINGNGATVQFASSNSQARGVFMLTGSSFITIDSLNINVLGTGTHGYGIHLREGANNNIVKNCIINIPLNLTSTFFAGVVMNTGENATIAGANAPHSNTIENCDIRGGYYGVTLISTPGAPAFFNKLINNRIHDWHFYGVFSNAQEDFEYVGNDIARPLRTLVSSFYGLYFTQTHAGGLVAQNAIHDPFTGSGRNTSIMYPFYCTNAPGTVARPVLVYNNILYNLNNNGTLYGIWNATSSHWKYYHNTLMVDDDLATTAFTYLFYLTGNSDGIEVRNNIFSMKRSGTSNRFLLYITGTGTRTFNNNAYFVDFNTAPTNLFFGFNGGNQSSFSNWVQAGGGWDNASVFDDPGYISATTGNLRPTSGAMNDIGSNLLTIVPTDFAGTARTTTPDPGAFEFSPPPCPRPSANLGGRSDTAATVTWSSGIAGGTYNVEWGPTGFTRGTGNIIVVSGNSLQLNGLTPATCYDIYVQLDCSGSGNGLSLWSNVFTFCTEVCDTAQSCTYTFRMLDSFGDGWNGNTMDIRQGSVTVAVIGPTFTTGLQQDISITLCSGVFSVFWNPGGSWVEEVGLEIYDPFNNLVFSLPFNSQTLQNSIIHTGVTTCGNITCLPPTQFLVAGVTDSSAAFTWTLGNGVATAIEYGVTGFTVGTGTRVWVTTSPATITGLSPNTQYEAYILDTCIDGSVSPAIGPRPFRTACQAVPMPYSDFYTNWPVPCWSYSAIGGNFNWEHYTIGGVNHAQARFWSFTQGNNALMTSVPIIIHTDAQVRYNWARNTSTFYPDTLYVLSRILGSPSWDTLQVLFDPNFGVPNAQNTAPAPLADFKDELFYLPNSYVGNAAQIQFYAKSGFGPNVYMDYFIVEAQPPCPDPTSLISTGATSTSVNLSWNQFGSGINLWEVEWGPVGFTPGTGNGTIVPAASNPFNLTGLNPGACIDIYVRANCNASGNGFSTNYAGPLNICLPWANDIEVRKLINPNSPTGCGDSTMAIRATIYNNGLNAASGIPIRANISGAFTATRNTTYAGPLAPGASDTVMIGTLNTFAGGYIDVQIVNLWSNDQNRSNDTLEVDSILLLPGAPKVLNAFGCGNPDSVDIRMQPFAATNYLWYNQPVGGTLLHTGNTFRVPASNPGPYYVEYLSGGGGSLTTLNTGGSGCGAGNMFDLVPAKTLNITGFDVRPFSSNAAMPLSVWMVTGSHSTLSGQAGWTLVHQTNINATANVLTRVNLPTPVVLQANQTYGFYVQFDASYTVGANTFSNSDLTFISGNGNCSPFDYCCTPRTFNGAIYYEIGGCSSPRVPVTATIYRDTAYATFTAIEVSAGVFNFDATGSQGHVYTWDFGDGGPLGSGMMTSHTYTQAGNYSVTLTVQDTICNTADSELKTVTSTISAETFALNQRLRVFPNPSRESFNLELDVQGLRQVYLRLLSPTGQLIHEFAVDDLSGTFIAPINLGGQAKGVYLLQLETETGVITRRLILI